MKLVNYHCKRSSGRNLREAWHSALVTGETRGKQMKVIILDVPCVVTWVALDEEKFMQDVRSHRRVVLDYDAHGVEVGRHLEGGREYGMEKAKKQFRDQWRYFNEGRMPRELSPGCG